MLFEIQSIWKGSKIRSTQIDCLVCLVLSLWLRPFNIQYQVIITMPVQQLDSFSCIVAVFECNVGKSFAQSRDAITSQIDFLVWSNFAYQVFQIIFCHRFRQIRNANICHIITATEPNQSCFSAIL